MHDPNMPLIYTKQKDYDLGYTLRYPVSASGKIKKYARVAIVIGNLRRPASREQIISMIDKTENALMNSYGSFQALERSGVIKSDPETGLYETGKNHERFIGRIVSDIQNLANTF